MGNAENLLVQEFAYMSWLWIIADKLIGFEANRSYKENDHSFF